MHYERSLRQRLLKLSRYFPAVVVTGARQSGKTTLLTDTFPDYRHISLDLPSIAEQAERNPAEFLAENPPPLLIDEIQYAPGLFRTLKLAIDTNRHDMGRYILTGNQQFVLMKGVSESLAGRAALIELETLSLHEINQHIQFNQQRETLLKPLSRGQFPELWRVPDLPAYEFYQSYLATYLERDVRQILNVSSLRDFERFLRLLAARNGNLLNKSELAKDVGVSVKAIGDWVSVLQASGQIVMLEPWFYNFGKRIVKTPKVYFRDTGFLAFLLNISAETLSSSPFLGAIWETMVFAELRKQNDINESRANFWFYRDQRAREIDFLIEKNGYIHFAEVKWSEQPSRRDTIQLRRVSEDLAQSNTPWKPGMLAVIGTPEVTYSIDEGIEALHIRAIDRLLN